MSHVPVQLAICVKSSDKLTKLASVQEAITPMVNGMQRYHELLVREEEKENNPAPIKGKNQLTIMSFAVTTPRYSQVPRAQLPIRSLRVKQIAKRSVGRPPKAMKARIEVELKCV